MRWKELTLYNTALVCILSILFSDHFPRCWCNSGLIKEYWCKSQIPLKTQWHLFSVNELYSLLDLKYTRQKQKSLNIWNMRLPKRAHISKTKVAKSYKNSLTKWLYCHTVLSHTNPSLLCYTNKGNLFDPLHPNNSIDILNTDLSTFPVVMTKRICLTIWNF